MDAARRLVERDVGNPPGYNTAVPNLPTLPTRAVPISIANSKESSRHDLPDQRPGRHAALRRNYDITAVLANNALANNLGVHHPGRRASAMPIADSRSAVR